MAKVPARRKGSRGMAAKVGGDLVIIAKSRPEMEKGGELWLSLALLCAHRGKIRPEEEARGVGDAAGLAGGGRRICWRLDGVPQGRKPGVDLDQGGEARWVFWWLRRLDKRGGKMEFRFRSRFWWRFRGVS